MIELNSCQHPDTTYSITLDIPEKHTSVSFSGRGEHAFTDITIFQMTPKEIIQLGKDIVKLGSELEASK